MAAGDPEVEVEVAVAGSGEPHDHAEVQRTTLPGGVRVVTEHMPGAHSVSTAFWVGVGARDEPAAVAGVSHFLEHLLFKGTDARTARQIAEAVDAVGGEMNAFTGREYTTYYTRLPADQLELGLDLLSDVLWAPAFRPHEVDAERQVILEELHTSEDSPEDAVHILLAAALFPEHPLGREVLGTPETIAAMGREDIRAFHGAHYRPANVVVAAAGRLDHDRVAAEVEQRFSGAEGGEPPRREAPVPSPRRVSVQRRPIEQAHVAVGHRSIDRDDEDRYALAVLNQVLGGGASSRLFQEIREERGLAYTVYSHVSAYSDSGTMSVYAATGPAAWREVLDVITHELQRLCDTGVTGEELRVATGYLVGATLLGLEDSGARMHRIGRSELLRGAIPRIDEVVDRFRSVTRADVARVIERVLTGPRTIAVVGPVDPREVEDRVA